VYALFDATIFVHLSFWFLLFIFSDTHRRQSWLVTTRQVLLAVFESMLNFAQS